VQLGSSSRGQTPLKFISVNDTPDAWREGSSRPTLPGGY